MWYFDYSTLTENKKNFFHVLLLLNTKCVRAYQNWILGTCNLGTDQGTRMLFIVFYSSIETALYIHVGKLLRAKHVRVSAICNSAYITRTVLQHNICNCCNNPCFEFIQRIHSLAVHLVFHITLKKKALRRKIWRTWRLRYWSSSSYPTIWEINVQSWTT
jgi:hypothetical protein